GFDRTQRRQFIRRERRSSQARQHFLDARFHLRRRFLGQDLAQVRLRRLTQIPQRLRRLFAHLEVVVVELGDEFGHTIVVGSRNWLYAILQVRQRVLRRRSQTPYRFRRFHCVFAVQRLPQFVQLGR